MGCNLCFGRNSGDKLIEISNDQNNNNENTGKVTKLKGGRKRKNNADDEEEEEIKIPSKNTSTLQLPDKIECMNLIAPNVLAVGLSTGCIEILNLNGNILEENLQINSEMAHHGSVKCIIPLNEDDKFASGGGDGKIKFWNSNTFLLIQNLDAHDEWVNCILQPKDSNVLISGSSDKTIKVFDLSNKNECIHTFDAEENVECLVDLFDGKFASNSHDNIIIWDLKSKSQLLKFDGTHNSITSLIYFQNNNILISGIENGVIKGYDLNEKKSKFTIRDHSDGKLNCMEAINDDTVAVGYGNIIKFRDVTNKTEGITLSGHSLDIKTIKFINGILISGGDDKSLKIWE